MKFSRILFALLAVLLIAVPTYAGKPSSTPSQIAEYKFENPAFPNNGCYKEDSVHRRTWYGSGTVTTDLPFCGSGGASLAVTLVGRNTSITVIAPDGRSWTDSNRKNSEVCISGFPRGSSGGHALQEGIWKVIATGSNTYFYINVDIASTVEDYCEVLIDPTIF